jgi:diaminopimelate epimerase
MKIPFFKYQGAGNDFVMIDNRSGFLNNPGLELVARLCDRRFGIGGDGLMLLENKSGYDFEMIYYNADGRLSSMCGNGGRCIAAFSDQLGITSGRTHFLAVDGPHETVKENNLVKLKMTDVLRIVNGKDYAFLNTGSPHYVKFVSGLDRYDVFTEGRKIRNSPPYSKEGTNVNFIEQEKDEIFVRTYERGVENETLACGTGVTAAALVAASKGLCRNGKCAIRTPGGKLSVYFKEAGPGHYTDIWLEGPAVKVFEGVVEI